MAFPSPPPPPKSSSALIFFLLLLTAATANGASSTIKSQEFDDMMQSLRNYGYTLFTNSIATSDLKYQLLSASAAAASNFTLFAPRDELLYALDMATDASVYVSTLRYHIVPNRRHTFADLKNLSAPFLDTLLPHFAVLVGKFRDVDVSNDRASVGVIVDGVRLSFPDLFVGSRIVVHGIDGILLTGLNMSRDPGTSDYDSDHFPLAGSPAPGVDANSSTENHAPTSQDVSPAPASSAFEGNIPPELHAPTDQLGWNYVSPTPAPFAFDGNIPPEIHAPTDQFGWSFVSPTPAPAVDGNIPVSPSPASAFDWNIPAEGTPQFGSNNIPVAPASNGADIPAEWTPIPTVPTPPASNIVGDVPLEGIDIPNVPTPPASIVVGDMPSVPTPQVDRNNVLAPPAFTIPSKGRSSTRVKGRPTTPASQISRNHVPTPAAGTLHTPRPHSLRSKIPAAATPRMTPDQIEKLKSYRRKHPGKSQRKGRRRHPHHRRRRRTVGDL